MLLHRVSFSPSALRQSLKALARSIQGKQSGWFVRCDLGAVPFIPQCACCLSPTSKGRRETSRHHPSGVVVPYCEECLAGVGRLGVRLLAWRLASILLGLAACAFVPLFAWITKPVAVVGAAAIAGLPGLAHVLWRAFGKEHQNQKFKATTSVAGGIACSNEEWARILSERMGTTYQLVQVRCSYPTGWAYGGVVIALLLTPWLFDWFHPPLRLLNLTDSVLSVSVDRHVIANVEPARGENPRAGVLTKVAAGHHVITARRRDGALVDEVTANVIAGQTHLFAPSRPKGICFWLERSGIGRNSNGKTLRELLVSENDFWALPDNIDGWFEPAPGSASTLGTGGTVISLRQGPCVVGGDD